MNKFALTVLAGLAGLPAALFGATADVRPLSGPFPLKVLPASAPAEATAGGFSVCFPIVTRVQGATTIFYTAIDVTNNSSQSAPVLFQYLSADGSINKPGTLVSSLRSRDNFHTDDFMQFLANAGIITQTQANSTFGTLLLTFDNSTFTKGNEATAVARIYNYVSGTSGPSIGQAYRATVLRQNGAHTLTSIIRDTKASTSAPAVVTNLGLANVGINDAGGAVNTSATITLFFYDPRTGNRVGTQPSFSLNPGQVVQINDVFSQFSIPAGTTELIVFADGPQGATATTIEGYVVLKDISTNDGSFFSMLEANGL